MKYGNGSSQKKRVVVGIVGKYCSGKNVLAGVLAEYGYLVIDVDKIGHEVLESSKREIVSAFGNEIIGEDGRIERKKLGAIVFGNRAKLRLLEAILHPRMVERVTKIVELSEQGVVINAALLYKMGLYKLCDVVFCVKAPVWKLLLRGLKRDKISLCGVFGRLLSQFGICFKPRGYRVDTYNVWNSGSIERFKSKALRLFRECDLIEENN